MESITPFARATTSSLEAFSSTAGLSGNGDITPGAKMEALHPLPSGLVSMRYPLYSKASTIVDGPFIGVLGRVEDGRGRMGHAATLLWLRIHNYTAIGI